MQPLRIISLCPSFTETLFDVGLGASIVGCTAFCIHPTEARQKAKVVGGTKNPNLDLIASLNPTHVIADLEENRADDIVWLKKHLPCHVFRISTVNDIFSFFDFIDLISTDKNTTQKFRLQIKELGASSPVSKPLNVFYPIWMNPWMSINKDTYIHDLLSLSGFRNVCGKMIEKYPTIKELLDLPTPDLVLLPSEPFHFKEEHLESIPWKNIPSLFVDGEMICWYGSRTPMGWSYLKRLRLSVN